MARVGTTQPGISTESTASNRFLLGERTKIGRFDAFASKFWRLVVQKTFQINDQIFGFLVAPFAFLGHHDFDHLAHPGGEFVVKVIGRGKRFPEVLFDDFMYIGAFERGRPVTMW